MLHWAISSTFKIVSWLSVFSLVSDIFFCCSRSNGLEFDGIFITLSGVLHRTGIMSEMFIEVNQPILRGKKKKWIRFFSYIHPSIHPSTKRFCDLLFLNQIKRNRNVTTPFRSFSFRNWTANIQNWWHVTPVYTTSVLGRHAKILAPVHNVSDRHFFHVHNRICHVKFRDRRALN